MRAWQILRYGEPLDAIGRVETLSSATLALKIVRFKGSQGSESVRCSTGTLVQAAPANARINANRRIG